MKTALLRATSADGIFPTERTFSFVDSRANKIVVLVPTHILKNAESNTLPVRIIADRGATYLVGLPGEIFGARGSMVEVPKRLIQVGGVVGAAQ